MAHDESPDEYHEAVGRGLQFARGLGRTPGPAHLLVGISLGGGPAAAALRGGTGRPPLREVVAAWGEESGSGEIWLHLQAQEAARQFAAGLGQRAEPWHLLAALLDQGTPEVTAALTEAGIDPQATRQAALAAVGIPADHPPFPMPSPMPAGALDRPPLPVDRLDERAWRVLRWRQDHLPLDRLRRRSQVGSLSRMEERAALRLADKLDVDDDQRYSLLHHHADQVTRRVAAARPDLTGPLRGRRRVHRPGPGPLVLMVGWGAWLENRRTGLRDRVFWLRTRAAYRDCPQD